MHDLVIRGGLIVDGTGSAPYRGDVAVRDGRLAEVGGKAGAAARELSAEGAIVTPGFVDIHTHYDAQISWDPYLTPSSWHGVTSVVMGNCGIGFAPARPKDRDWLIGLMESVEEIPRASLREGIRWEWESFPEFMDALARSRPAIDIGAQVPHAALRAYVMGERGAANQPATADDLRDMSRLVREGMLAGALGFTGTRTANHRSFEGVDAPGYGVDTLEVTTLAKAAGAAGVGGLIGFVLDYVDVDQEIAWLRRLQRECGLPVWTNLVQTYDAPEKYAAVLERMTQAGAAGEQMYGQSPGRPLGGLLGLTSSRNPFMMHPSYKEIAHLPLKERVSKLRDPVFRARLLSEKVEADTEVFRTITGRYSRMFRLGDPPDYEPPFEKSVEAMAKTKGVTPAEMVLDIMLERNGEELLFTPLASYADGDHQAIMAMLQHPHAFLGLGDAGAHVARTCDAATPSFMLTHWARDRRRGPTLKLEDVIRLQTSRTASIFGLNDRGVLATGKKADLNVIDFAGMRLRPPEMLYDFPGKARRLVQRADGYIATVVSGEPIFENGSATGAMPGALIRGTR